MVIRANVRAWALSAASVSQRASLRIYLGVDARDSPAVTLLLPGVTVAVPVVTWLLAGCSGVIICVTVTTWAFPDVAISRVTMSVNWCSVGHVV